MDDRFHFASGDAEFLKDDGRRYWPIEQPRHLDWQKLGLWFIAMLINGGLWVGIIYAITWLL